jgi:FlaA1/EpsC-like NDP-sugar epimerase
MTRQRKGWILRGADLLLIGLANVVAYVFVSDYVQIPGSFYAISFLLGLALYYLLAQRTNVYQQVVRYSGLQEYATLWFCCTAAFLFKLLLFFIFQQTVSHRFLFLVYLFALTFILGSRLVWRLFQHNQFQFKVPTHAHTERTLIVGAGAGAEQLITRNKQETNPVQIVGLIDDHPDKQRTIIQGIRVIGKTSKLPHLIEQLQIHHVIIADNLSSRAYKRLVNLTKPAGVRLSRLPKITEPLYHNAKKLALQTLDIADLLERDEVTLDQSALKQQLQGKTILITGAGGSIGSEIVRQLTAFQPKRLLLLGHGENSIYLIKKHLAQYSEIESIPLIADVQDYPLMQRLFKKYQPDIVYHAAAHKHVPLMEDNPHAAVKNNVFGTYNVARAASEAGVKRFVMISTDKAVNPPNVMGASKRLAEMIVTNLNRTSQTQFVVVRFGNVLGSRGSVVPLFKEQIAQGGPVTVTDFRMTRYFMTIPEASRLVIQAGELAQGGELFVLDMGQPVKILDLAKRMIALAGVSENQIKIVESGIRPGEKLHEKLLVSAETAQEQVHEKIFLGQIMPVAIEDIISFAEGLLTVPANELKATIVEFACRYNGEQQLAEEVV